MTLRKQSAKKQCGFLSILLSEHLIHDRHIIEIHTKLVCKCKSNLISTTSAGTSYTDNQMIARLETILQVYGI